MTPTDTDLFLARIHARALDGDSFAAADVLRLLSLVEDLSRELLAARSVGTPLGAAPALSAEGSIPSSPRPSTSAILVEVANERARQDAKWGEQNHRDACPALLDRKGGVEAWRLAEDLEIPTAARAKAMCQTEFGRGQGNWASVLVEEVAEAVAAIGGDDDLRRELVQVAAVSVAWIEAIDRRASSPRPLASPPSSPVLTEKDTASSLLKRVQTFNDPVVSEMFDALDHLASPPSSPTPPAPEAALELSCSAAGSEGGHGAGGHSALGQIPRAPVGGRLCPDCAQPGMRISRRAGCLTCMGTGVVGVP